jgi:hypothetical protein
MSRAGEASQTEVGVISNEESVREERGQEANGMMR